MCLLHACMLDYYIFLKCVDITTYCERMKLCGSVRVGLMILEGCYGSYYEDILKNNPDF